MDELITIDHAVADYCIIYTVTATTTLEANTEKKRKKYTGNFFLLKSVIAAEHSADVDGYSCTPGCMHVALALVVVALTCLPGGWRERGGRFH